MNEKVRFISLEEMKRIYNNPNIYSQFASGHIMFSYFMDCYCYKLLEDNENLKQIYIMNEGNEVKRYGITDEEALKNAIIEEDYLEAARLTKKINNKTNSK